MKKTLFLLLVPFVLAAQPLDKLSYLAKKEFASKSSGASLVWVTFTDKGNTAQWYAAPERVVSAQSLARRSKVLPAGALLDATDLPLPAAYIAALEQAGAIVRQKSKWFNSVSVWATWAQVQAIAAMPFVRAVDVVARMKKAPEPVQLVTPEEQAVQQPKGTYVLDYGTSVTQLQQINVPAVHNLGITGQGVTVGVLDAGFNRLSHECFAGMQIIAKYDFVNHWPNVGDSTGMGTGTHGTQTLSTIGGFKQGQLIGPAFGAKYVLAKTENTDSETPIEEDNWIAAMEWADSIGVDVTSTSLGYLTFDSPYPSYTWQSMNGNTCRITIGADLAVKKGIVVVNSAGNEGYSASNNTLGAPADGDSVIAVGAVTSAGTRASFSSVGNTVDGRIKPDIMAMGSGVKVASTTSNNQYSSFASGTSFSCPLAAGVAALILSYNPRLTPMQVRDAMRLTASKASIPDREYGWGILNALNAINFFPLPVELTTFTASASGQAVTLAWATATEKNNRGFEVQRSYDGAGFAPVGFVAGSGTTTAPVAYSFIDNAVASGTAYYRLLQLDFDGSSRLSDIVSVTPETVTSYHLQQNYPNPFNPSTRITFTLGKPGIVDITVYDLLGNVVGSVYSGFTSAGTHSVTYNGSALASGAYLCKIQVTDGNRVIWSSSNKMLLMK